MNVSSLASAFASASVEFLETAAIAYALARAGFRREAIAGTAVGLLVVAFASVLSWRVLEKVPVHIFQGCIGFMLFVVGGLWITKSIKRTLAGRRARWISDPLAVCGRLVEDQLSSGFNGFNMLLMAKSAAVEGLEVAIIVVSIGVASRAWIEVTVGVACALLGAVGAVVYLHGRLQTVPEAAIKLGTGVVLLILGTFWMVVGMTASWK